MHLSIQMLVNALKNIHNLKIRALDYYVEICKQIKNYFADKHLKGTGEEHRHCIFLAYNPNLRRQSEIH